MIHAEFTRVYPTDRGLKPQLNIMDNNASKNILTLEPTKIWIWKEPILDKLNSSLATLQLGFQNISLKVWEQII